ncbi:beta-ketoacyl-ACP synthase II [Fructilactobacillus fructivorans]|uniref:3-oxoacyl-[acyl-carrier-protein] synthase 2 n=1 Tax=Fructilactobacillus fructivorans TaxID=1614 RepID=A0A0C1M6B1_9LACO|nr:beta-ketoacyl-ACP synthase II [Fructilactobacillus fructivorans]KID41754.1 3-oxoacyl-[acyl-carrier-protein] synthase, KASII [Fructilactobacillus fructivorans]MCT0151924.1 beta-ketoacyl-[acyl-carrier-protein] synthase II [Fructilactobacillus fructivorans]MCT2868158.1 beta-ketoacyl-[acyl-carrier-protein] synthase II [Fructilactobacillus fructivorans]MCT2869399.1 beta-ketoacyl-[acyl-carrier-protein] synthase II [Fructilactobacillus fructivorans]MCT2874128.1 beta-ketoacyl-[acyl-carrier-protein]
MSNRVVVTGMGAVTPIGNDANAFAHNLFNSKVGIAPITKFDASDTGVTVAAEVKDFDPGQRLDKRDYKRIDLFSQYALYSAKEAMDQAGLKKGDYDPEDLGVMYGNGIGGLTTIESDIIKMHDKGPKRVSPLFVPKAIANMASGNVSIYFDAENTSQTIVTACASANNAIGNAFELIKQGKAKMMIAGGTEAAITEIGIAGFAKLTALSTAKKVEDASMPFDENRNGFVMGEGAGTLILEDYDHAKARGANILAEVVGYGATSDAYHMTAPNPSGKGAIKAMQEALDEGNIKTSELDYVNAHGTSTHANDVAEAGAIEKLFNDNDHVKVSSIKGMVGHSLGAAGGLEAVALVAALQNDQMPVNVGMKHKDPEIHVDLVDEDNKKAPVNTAISNAFGFGGHNAVIAMKKWNED